MPLSTHGLAAASARPKLPRHAHSFDRSPSPPVVSTTHMRPCGMVPAHPYPLWARRQRVSFATPLSLSAPARYTTLLRSSPCSSRHWAQATGAPPTSATLPPDDGLRSWLKHCISLQLRWLRRWERSFKPRAWGSTFVKLKKTNFLPFLKQRQAPCILLEYDFALQYLHYVNETIVALRTPLLIHFIYPYETKITIVCYA
jgi:hypothetical protein